MTHEQTVHPIQRLFAYDTAEDLGPATMAQVAASDAAEAKGQHGVFAIDEDGDVVAEGEQVFGPTRIVYTQ